MHCTIPQRDQYWTLHPLLQLNLQGKSENTWQSQIKSPAESWLCGHCQYINYFLLMWKLYDSSRLFCVIFLSSHIKMTADGACWCKELTDQGVSFMSKLNTLKQPKSKTHHVQKEKKLPSWVHTQTAPANLLQSDSVYMISNTSSMKLISNCRKAHRVRRCECAGTITQVEEGEELITSKKTKICSAPAVVMY